MHTLPFMAKSSSVYLIGPNHSRNTMILLRRVEPALSRESMQEPVKYKTSLVSL